MKKLKIAMLGFGNAGQAFAKMLELKRKEIIACYNVDVQVVAIATGTKGTIIDLDGIDLLKVCKDVESYGKFTPGTKGLTHADSLFVVKHVDYDLVLELTPLNIFTGQPAIEHIKSAFARGKHVVTANKGPIAWAFRELKEMAEAQGSMFFYETTVMDGTPVFNLREHTLKMCKVTQVSGILNSTTNYILEELAAGKEYDQVIAAGKKAGFIEADPAMDIQGYDAAAKITALLNVLMDADITPDKVDREGIENITVQDIKDALARGKVIKLLCKGEFAKDELAKDELAKDEASTKTTEDGISNKPIVLASVKPVLIDKNDLLASIDGTSSVVSITTDLMGKISVVEHAPEIEQTAYGVFGDLLRVLEGLK